MDFRKTYYVLPNLFTLSTVLCGFASLALSVLRRAAANLYLAALAICFGLLFDTFDGRVARLTKTQTDLGRDLDSLADVITFGAAPALLMYKWGLNHFGLLGIFMAGLYVCAGALRLARFNVLSRRNETSGKAIPASSCWASRFPPQPACWSSWSLSATTPARTGSSEGSTALIVLVLSALMVSRVRFRSFKELRLNLKTVGSSCWWSAPAPPSSWPAGEGVHLPVPGPRLLVLGLAEEVIFFRRRRAQERSELHTPAPEAAPTQEEEVLRELGAFDGEDEESEQFKDPLAALTTPERQSRDHPASRVGPGPCPRCRLATVVHLDEHTVQDSDEGAEQGRHRDEGRPSVTPSGARSCAGTCIPPRTLRATQKRPMHTASPTTPLTMDVQTVSCRHGGLPHTRPTRNPTAPYTSHAVAPAPKPTREAAIPTTAPTMPPFMRPSRTRTISPVYSVLGDGGWQNAQGRKSGADGLQVGRPVGHRRLARDGERAGIDEHAALTTLKCKCGPVDSPVVPT